MAQHQPQQTQFFAKEVNSVYVFRHMDQNELSIKCELLANQYDVDPTQREYRETQQDSPVDCIVRIPALMLFCAPQSHNYNNQMITFFVNDYRHQFGSHLLITSYDGDIREIHICWMGKARTETQKAAHIANQRQYTIYSAIKVSCVYPCNIPVNDYPSLCFGLVFTSRLSLDYHQRTYARIDQRLKDPNTQLSYYDFYEPSHLSFDLLDNFIDRRPAPNHEHYSNDSLFRSDHKFAIYVCRGAKLIVADERYPRRQGGHTRSLFQSGTVAVFTANRFEFNYSILGTDGTQNYRRQWYDFFRQHTLHDARVQGQLDTYELSQDPKDTSAPVSKNIIATKASRVIFLGAVHSQFNTVCYNLCINSHTSNPDENFVSLNMPEGAYIEDISSWNAGFAQIYARHRYERLFATTQSPSMAQPFQVPADQYMQKRILGILDTPGREWGFPLVVNYEAQQIDVPRDYENDRRDTDIRMYIHDLSHGQMTRKSNAIEWFTAIPTWIDQLDIPISPPLYPPVLKANHELHYLTVGQKVNVVDGQVAVKDRRFQIDKEPERYELKEMDIKSYGWRMWNERNREAVVKANQLDNEANPEQALIDREFKRISRDYWSSLKYYGPHPSGHLDLNHKGTCKSWVLVLDAPPAPPPPPPPAPVVFGQGPGDEDVDLITFE